MAAFGQSEIGFYLQMDDRMSPKLAKAQGSYDKFTKAMEGMNQRVYKSSTNTFDKMGGLADSFAKLPKVAVTQYGKMLADLKGKMRVLTQEVRFDFKPQERKRLTDMISGSVVKAMGKVAVKLSAAVPTKRSKQFASDVPLSQLYKKMPQPPDMVGKFTLPRYAKGRGPRRITGGAGGTVDDQLALLARDEMVIPAAAARHIARIGGLPGGGSGMESLPLDFTQKMADVDRFLGAMQSLPRHAGGRTGKLPPIDDLISMVSRADLSRAADSRKQVMLQAGQPKMGGASAPMPAGFTDNMARVENLMKGMPALQAAYEIGDDPKGMKKFNQAAKEADGLIKKLMKDTQSYDKVWRARMLPTFIKFHKELKGIKTDALATMTPLGRLFGKVIGPAKTIAIAAGINQVATAAHDFAHAVDAGTGFISASAQIGDSWNDINRTLHLAPAGFKALKSTLFDLSTTMPAGATDVQQMSVALDDLVKVGLDSDFAVKLAGPMSMFSKATGTALGDTANFVSSLNTLGMSADQIAGRLATMQKSANGLSVDIPVVTSAMGKFADENGQWLQSMSKQDAATAMDTLAKVTTAAESAQKGLGTTLSSIIGQGISDPTKMGEMAMMLHKSTDEVKKMLTSGDAAGILGGLQDATKGMGQFEVTTFAQHFGFDPKMLTVASQKGDQAAKTAESMTGSVNDLAAANKQLGQGVLDTQMKFGEQAEAQAKQMAMQNQYLDDFTQAASKYGAVLNGVLHSGAHLIEAFGLFKFAEMSLPRFAGLFGLGGAAAGGGGGAAGAGAAVTGAAALTSRSWFARLLARFAPRAAPVNPLTGVPNVAGAAETATLLELAGAGTLGTLGGLGVAYSMFAPFSDDSAGRSTSGSFTKAAMAGGDPMLSMPELSLPSMEQINAASATGANAGSSGGPISMDLIPELLRQILIAIKASNPNISVNIPGHSSLLDIARGGPGGEGRSH